MPGACLYQMNTRVALRRLTAAIGRPARLDDLPDAELDRLAGLGFDWVWCLGVWETGPVGRAIARSVPDLRAEYARALPDLSEDDICGSCFAVRRYAVAPELGGLPALHRLHLRLRERGIRLMLDFVPNHTARDHPWLDAHPEFYVQGSAADLAGRPGDFYAADVGGAARILAHGRDPYFAGWTDTAQLDYAAPATQDAMRAELRRIAEWCDGVRCDMAMLLLPDVFERTWGRRPAPFWPRAIAEVRERQPDFLLLAEVYWGLERELQRQGFDYTYDKGLYDRLRAGEAAAVRDHLASDPGAQARCARFLENHDEPRAAAVFPPDRHRAAAVAAFFCPGLRFFHEGQRAGRRVKIPVQLCRGPAEPDDLELRAFYERLLACLRDDAVREGAWQLLECRPAWDGNPTWTSFLAYLWSAPRAGHRIVAINYGGTQGQCFVRLPVDELAGRRVRLRDRLGPAAYDRDGDDLRARGLYLDMPAWGSHVFEVGVD